jgi:pimeloyl-ACP methyl ester carboxylesterase
VTWTAVGGVALVLALAGVVYQQIGLARDARRFPPPGSFIDALGDRLHVVRRGLGTPTVVFESALATSSLSWTALQADAARVAATCAYDRAGFAWSEPPARRRTFARTVDQLEAVVATCTPPYVLVGHSFGVFVCLEYAQRHPEVIAGLVLVDPPSDWMTVDRRQRRLLRGGIVMSRLGQALAGLGVVRGCLALLTGGAPGASRRLIKLLGPTTSRTLERLVGEVRKLPPDVHPVVQAMWSRPCSFAAMAEHIRMMSEATAAVASIATLHDVPLVVISSGDQPPAVVDAHRALAGLSTRGRVVIASKSGHWVPYDEPELILEAIGSVVRGAS